MIFILTVCVRWLHKTYILFADTAWSDRNIRRDVSININIEDCHIDSFNFFHEFVKNVDESFDNHADIVFNNFLIKKSVILSYHRKENSDFLTYNNLAEKE